MNGDVQGTVVDPSGAAVPGARIVLRNAATNYQRTQTSGADGSFLVREVPSGEYQITVARNDFRTSNGEVTVSVGSVANLTIALTPALVNEMVTVSSAPNVIDSTQTSFATAIDPERIEELPVQSRNYLNFALLAAGVTEANQGGSRASASLPATGFSFGGLRPRSNAIYIDGMDNNDEFTGASRTELSLETVREFQVVNQGLSAEAGGAAGGSINVVTKAGTNVIHGDAFIFAENGALDAKPALEGGNGKPDLNRWRAGFSIGGPLRKDRTFYYTGFEQEHARGQAASDVSAVTIAALNPFLAQGKVPGVNAISNAYFPTSRAETEASGRFDHRLTTNNFLSFRYAFTNNREANDVFNTGELVDASARGSSFTKDHSLSGALTTVLNENRLNDIRFQFASRDATLRTVDQTGPGILIPGFVEFGRPYFGNNVHHENHFEVSDTFSQSHGAHLLKAGATVNRIHLRAAVLDGFGGTYIFASVNDLLSGTPAYYQQAFGNPNTNFAVNRFAAFAQDRWRISHKLTLDFGARYDYEQLPSLFHQDANNVSPRIGVAYSPANNWVIRSGFGMFYDRYPLAYVNEAVQKNGINAFDQTVDQFPLPLPFPLTVATAPLGGVPISIYRPQPNMANPYSEVATAGVERGITKNMSASATYTFVRGVKLPRTVNVNLLPPTVLTPQNALSLGVLAPDAQQLGRLVFSKARIDPRFDAVNELNNESSSTYHGLSLTLNRRLANEFEFLATYTLSKSIDDASDFSESPQNPYNLRAERALSANDQRHRFVVSALFDLPIGEEEDRKPGEAPNLITRIFSNIEVAPILTLGSGRPVDPLTGFDSTRTHTFPLASRPLGYARNSLRTPANAVLDLRVLKFFKVGEHGKFDIVAEAFNVFNRVNITQLNPWFGTASVPVASFGRPGEASGPRRVQFSLDYEF